MVKQEPAQILLVDDEAGIRVTLGTLLQRSGYHVTAAANGEEALGWLMQRSFDLLLIDMKLPGMDGLTFAQLAQKCQPSTTIVFISGSSDVAGGQVEPQVDYFDYILKSASPQEVLERIAAAVEAHRVAPGQTRSR